MTEAAVNLTDDPEVRSTERGIVRAVFRVAVSGRREQEASFFTVVVWRDQTGHAAWSPAHGQPATTEGRPRSWQDPGLRTRGQARPCRESIPGTVRLAPSAVTRRLASGYRGCTTAGHMKRHIIAPPMTHDPLSRWMPSTGRSPSTVVLAGLP